MNIVKLCSQNSYGFHCNRASTGINRSMSLIIQRKIGGDHMFHHLGDHKNPVWVGFCQKRKTGNPQLDHGF